MSSLVGCGSGVVQFKRKKEKGVNVHGGSVMRAKEADAFFGNFG